MSCYPLPAAAVLQPTFLPQYEQITGSIFSEVVQLNTTLYIINKIVEFPFHLFGDGVENVFFYMNVLNGTEISVAIAYCVVRPKECRQAHLSHPCIAV